MSARKNLLVIVEALAKLTESERYPLVIIGRKTEYTNVVEEYAKKAGIHHLLVFPKDVSNAELPGVYQGGETIPLFVAIRRVWDSSAGRTL